MRQNNTLEEIIAWLRQNKAMQNQYSQEEFANGIELLTKTQTNQAITLRMRLQGATQFNKAQLFFLLEQYTTIKIKASQKTDKVQTFKSGKQDEKTQIVKEKPITIKEKVNSIKDVFTPQIIIDMKARSGELFRMAGKLHRQMVERNWDKKKLTEKEIDLNKQQAEQIVEAMDEDVDLLNKIDIWDKTQKIVEKEEKKKEKDYSQIDTEELKRLYKQTKDYITKNRKKATKAKGIDAIKIKERTTKHTQEAKKIKTEIDKREKKQ